MEAIRVISTTTIQARSHVNNGDSPQLVDLNPWDLQYLIVEYAQKGLLYQKPTSSSSSLEHTETVIQRLKDSLSLLLDVYPPLAGRLAIIPDDDDDTTSSVFITCNNAGVSFVHAVAETTTIADIVEPIYVPPIVASLFPPGNIKNFEGTHVPLMFIQVTELVDGIFIASSKNHCLLDVKPGWDFWNTWAEISRNGFNNIELNSKLATFEKWFPHGSNIERPIRIPFKEIIKNHSKASNNSLQPNPISRRIFHFKREAIVELKAKANMEVDNGVSNRISSLQAVMGHVWRSAIRNQNLDEEEEVTFRFIVSARSRVSHPPIPDNYFGNTVQYASVTMKVRDLVGDGGLGKFTLEMNNKIALFTEEKIKKDFEAWIQNPKMSSQSSHLNGKFLSTGSSPRTNFYQIDFGWGRPVAIRRGTATSKVWKLVADAGAEEGSFDFELCMSYEILEAMAKDTEFMHMVSPLLPPPLGLSDKHAQA